MVDFARMRQSMVEGQIKPNGVTDLAVLSALGSVPREVFLPKAMRGYAYIDEDLHLGNNRYLVEPLVLARLLNEAAITRADVVLDIGCASGYSTALLAHVANTVVAVETDADLARTASENLRQLGLDNAVVVEGPLTAGYADQAPFQVIVLGGAVAEIPTLITDQLAPGGRLVTVLRTGGGVGRGMLVGRFGEAVSRREFCDAATPWLPGFEPRPVFQF